MTFNLSPFDVADTTHLYLHITPAARDDAWQQSQVFSKPSQRWHAYLNFLCLNVILPYLQEEWTQLAKPWPHGATLPSFLRFIHGIAIQLGEKRLLVVPTAITESKLWVEQEWVDIAPWVCDYYLAAQVNPDDGYVRILGYTTHQQLKTRGNYDASYHTYSLDEDDLIQDMAILLLEQEFCPNEATRATIPSLSLLQSPQARNLLELLGDPAIADPRLEVAFDSWAGLVAHEGWRQDLYERSLGLPDQRSIKQWLQRGIPYLIQQSGWQRIEFASDRASTRGSDLALIKGPDRASTRGSEETATAAFLSRCLVIAGQEYNLRIIPSRNPTEMTWCFELRHAVAGRLIPGGFKLRLLTEDLQEFESNEAIATTAQDRLFVEVILEPGEGVVWETEPTPENYYQEILRF